MGTVAAVERDLLCDLFLEVGADAPTLSGEWTTRDLAAHLVIRERRPDAGPGILTSAFASYSERVRLAETEKPYPEIVRRVRTGPPLLSPMRVDAVDRLVNTIEFFVHHEDVRRARLGWTARPLGPDLDDTLAALLPGFAKLLVRKCPVGIVLAPHGRPSTRLRDGDETVELSGPIGECVLYLYGRAAVAEVDLDGSDDAVRTLNSTFGI